MLNILKLSFLHCFVSFIRSDEVDRINKIIDNNIRSESKWSFPEKLTDFPENLNGRSKNFGLFDFVIVGAGSAGVTLARRLSEHKKWKILLLEAGGNETEYSRIPAVATNILASDMNWGYRTIPQKNYCQSSNNKQCGYPRGKILGGTSSINSMVYSRGVAYDFEKWAQLGNRGWSFDKVLCYFKKSQKANFRGDNNYTGYNGPQNVEFNTPFPTIFRNVFKAYNQLGYPTIKDSNGRRSIGVSARQATIVKGKRHSGNTAFLQSILERKNLKLLTKALATKIVFNEDNSVKELQFLYRNQSYFVKPKLELLVAGGAINTPQLLMLSGIGPRRHLESINISVIADLPVGKNLSDHAVTFSFQIQNNATVEDYNLPEQIKQYVKGYGPLTFAPAMTLHFFRTDNLTLNYPNIEATYTIPNLALPDLTLKVYNINDELKANFVGIKPNTLTLNVILLHPKSRGQVTLKSSKYIDFPLIDTNYFSDPNDIETLYKGIDMSLAILNTTAMKEINAILEPNRVPKCKGLEGKASILCLIRHLTSGAHPCGTCRMGNDRHTSVVNTNLQVHGFKKLRVIDASVMPIIGSGHMHSVIVMIADKIADEIKRLYLGQKPRC